MTTNNDTKVTTVTETCNSIRHECGDQIAKATEAALAVPPDPRWTYRTRLLQAVVAAGPDLSEHQLYSAWRTDETLEPLTAVMHHALCAMRFWRLTDAINQWAADEGAKEATHQTWLARRNDNI
jgi:hypothetical protein